MKQSLFTTAPGYLLVVMAGAVCSTNVSANAAADCRQEATDYGVAEEQLEDYITGCMASRGELYAEETPDIEHAPADEAVGEEVLLESPPEDGSITY